MNFSNPITRHVSGVMNTFQGGPGIQTQHGSIFTPLPNVPPGQVLPISSPPMASGGGGAGASSKAGASNPNKSSSLSDSGDIDPESLDEDIDKIKDIEKELKKKEEAQKAEEKRLNEEEKKLKRREAEANKDTNDKRKTEELQKIKDEKAKFEEDRKKLEEDRKKLEEDKKVTTEQRKQLDEVIAPPFAKTDEKSGKIIKKDGDIQFIEKKSPELEKLKQLIREKDPETLEKVRKALEEFNKYREEYPSKKQNLQTITPNNYLLGQTQKAPPPKTTDIFGTLNFEEEAITSVA